MFFNLTSLDFAVLSAVTVADFVRTANICTGTGTGTGTGTVLTLLAVQPTASQRSNEININRTIASQRLWHLGPPPSFYAPTNQASKRNGGASDVGVDVSESSSRSSRSTCRGTHCSAFARPISLQSSSRTSPSCRSRCGWCSQCSPVRMVSRCVMRRLCAKSLCLAGKRPVQWEFESGTRENTPCPEHAQLARFVHNSASNSCSIITKG